MCAREALILIVVVFSYDKHSEEDKTNQSIEGHKASKEAYKPIHSVQFHPPMSFEVIADTMASIGFVGSQGGASITPELVTINTSPDSAHGPVW